jgi:hydroxyacylglutathione hydrolase
MGAFTGDFLFVGDVGRPDLLEKAAGITGTMENAARQLYASIRRFRELPDWLLIWPGHGAGSACGKALGAIPQSSLGYEKRFNWAFRVDGEEAFVRAVLEGQPEPPRYFAEMKRVNRIGPRVLGGLPNPARVDDARILEVMDSGGFVVDARRAPEFARAHVPGTFNIPLNRSFTTWAGNVVPYDRPYHLLVDGESAPEAVAEAVRDLTMIGLDALAGWFGAGAVNAWAGAGRTLGTVESASIEDVEAALESDTAEVLDVRARSEWDAGHLPGARNIPLPTLLARLDDIPPDRRVVLQCQTGNRSVIAASLLRARGFENIANYPGGFAEWSRSGRPVERKG